MTITVVTAIFSGYDTLKEQLPQDVDVEWVCVTDDPNLTSATWKIHHQPLNPLVHPRYTAKVPKCVPWLWVGRGPVVWMDASFVVKSMHAIGALIDAVPQSHPLHVGQFIHPSRSCIYDEAQFSHPLPKYTGQPIMQQAMAYAEAGHAAHDGLWATGLIVYPTWSYEAQERGMRWLTEQVTWTNQDQISQPHVWRLYGRPPQSLPGHLINNEFVTLHPHLDGT